MCDRSLCCPSSTTREEGRATGLYPSGVYPCSVSLGFRGSPTPRPRLDATPQPSSAMHGLIRSFIVCVSTFNPSFAANLAPPPARRGSIPAALSAPLRFRYPRPPPSYFITVLGRLQCLPLFLSSSDGPGGSAGCSLAFHFLPHPHTVVAFCVPLGVFPVRVPVGFLSGFRGAG